MTDPLGVTISAREIYDQIVGLRGDVRSLTESNEHVTQKLADHETRIRKVEELPPDTGARLTAVERWKYGMPVATLAAIASAVVTVVKSSGKA